MPGGVKEKACESFPMPIYKPPYPLEMRKSHIYHATMRTRGNRLTHSNPVDRLVGFTYKADARLFNDIAAKKPGEKKYGFTEGETMKASVKKYLLITALFVGIIWTAGCAGTCKTANLQLVTENYPPITFIKDGKVTGFATEVVQEILKRQNHPDTIRMMAWDDAYNLALKQKDVVLFSTTRTEKREKLFKWIGPIGSYHDVLYAKKGSSLVISSLEEAKKVRRIGVVDGWFSTEFLAGLGFKNLESTKQPMDNARKLIEGKVDLCAFTDMTAPEILKEAGSSMDAIVPAYVIKTYEFYIAISKDTSDEIVNRWRRSFDEMKADGTFEKISRKWVPGTRTAVK
jgi:polar amino acid transport system substrate-binding protein